MSYCSYENAFNNNHELDKLAKQINGDLVSNSTDNSNLNSTINTLGGKSSGSISSTSTFSIPSFLGKNDIKINDSISSNTIPSKKIKKKFDIQSQYRDICILILIGILILIILDYSKSSHDI